MPRPAPDEYEETLVQSTILAGQFEVIRKLGEGGMGEVHLAKDLHLNDRLVAIKTLPTLRAASNRAMKQLKREAATMLELTHEHIVRFYHFGDHQGLPFMVMQYIEGQTLDDLLDEKEKLTESELIELLHPIADALDYAHAKGIVHKDIKPANIFIEGKTGKLYLADFGIARVVKDTISQVTGKDTTTGTLHYMSPEQCRGEWDLTPASDIYSFATVLYECLVGNVPFHTGPVRELILHQEPTPLKGESPMSAQIMRGLAKLGDERPAKCATILKMSRSAPPSPPPSLTPAQPARLDQPAARRSEHSESSDSNQNRYSPNHGDKKTIELDDGVSMTFIYIDAPGKNGGRFQMGSPSDEKDRSANEGPQHRVTLSKGFWLGETEVTQAQWYALMQTKPWSGEDYAKEGGTNAASYISWKDANSFCNKLSQSKLGTFRLPSEAEWEYACRTGNQTRFSFGNRNSDLSAYAWYYGNTFDRDEKYAHAVGKKKPNLWGLYDMHGNVWEWCADVWHGNYRGAPMDGSAWTRRGDSNSRVLRGGSRSGIPRNCLSASRRRNQPDTSSFLNGFRVAMDLN